MAIGRRTYHEGHLSGEVLTGYSFFNIRVIVHSVPRAIQGLGLAFASINQFNHAFLIVFFFARFHDWMVDVRLSNYFVLHG